MSTHYIIMFDRMVPHYVSDYSNPAVIGKLSDLLNSNGYDSSDDYISMVGYGLSYTYPSIDSFVKPYKDRNGKAILWRRGDGLTLRRLIGSNWPEGNQPALPGGKSGSFQSLCKPYSVIATSPEGTHPIVERTLLLVVTDEKVNGTDDNYRQEWSAAHTVAGADAGAFMRLEPQVVSEMTAFNEHFKFDEVPVNYNDRQTVRVPISADGEYKIIPYELISAYKPSVHAVTNLPSPLPLRRVRGGYRLKAEVSPTDSEYEVVAAKLTDSNGDVLGETTGGNIDFEIPSDKLSAGDSVTFEMQLLYKDGQYDGALISADNPRYAKGMTVQHTVSVEDARVLGFMPLADLFWWWYPNDVGKACLVWNCVILFAILLAIIYLIWKLNKRTLNYNVTPDEVSMRCVQSSDWDS